MSKPKKVDLLGIEKTLEPINKTIQNGFEWKDLPIIKTNNNSWDFDKAAWGFVPYWINSQEKLLEHRKKYSTLNATCENILESKMYRQDALQHRCIIPISYFFEWRHFKPQNAKKDIAYPYLISPKSNEEEPIFFIAGIYNSTIDFETGESIFSTAIITTKANRLMEQIHNSKKRMPTILDKKLAEEWLTNKEEKAIKEIASTQIESNLLDAITISKDFKTSINLEAFEYDELPSLIL